VAGLWTASYQRGWARGMGKAVPTNYPLMCCCLVLQHTGRAPVLLASKPAAAAAAAAVHSIVVIYTCRHALLLLLLVVDSGCRTWSPPASHLVVPLPRVLLLASSAAAGTAAGASGQRALGWTAGGCLLRGTPWNLLLAAHAPGTQGWWGPPGLG
jgi:hypothetical protein